ncbi:MAG: hypothetical protein ACYSUX_00170 [Planctomycetota bacterium]|jgi:hypothetical protein
MKKRLLQTFIFLVLYGAVLVVDSYVFRIPERTAANDTVNFTINTHVFDNQWQAEQAMDDAPILVIDSVGQIRNLQFAPPAPAGPQQAEYDTLRGHEDFQGPFEKDSLLLFAQLPGTICVDHFEMILAPLSTAQKYLTGQFEADGDSFDLMDKSIVFVPAPNGKSCTIGIQEILRLPNDTAGDVNPEMADDASIL